MALPSLSPLLALLSLLLLLTLVAPPSAEAHTYHMGKCPRLPPMQGFVLSRFLGRWNVLYKTSTRVRCLTNEYSWADGAGAGAGGAKGEWAEEEEEAAAAALGRKVKLVQRMQLPLPTVNHVVRYVGALTPDPDPARAAAFTVKFPFNMLGGASYIVFDTDYDSYATVFSCQQIALWYRQSASIMTRGRTLSATTIQKLQNQLAAHGVNIKDMNTIRRPCDDADDNQGIQVHIKPKVFNSNATAILEDTSHAVATAAEAAKRALDVYNTVSTVYTGVAIGSGRRRREASEEFDPSDWMP